MTASIDRLAGAWRQRVGTAARRTLLALAIAALFGAAHLARVGTGGARLGAAALLAAAVVAFAVRAWRDRRDFRDARRALERVLVPTDRPLGEKTLRALSLIERTASEPNVGSSDLAALHFERLLARASVEAVERTADQRALRFRWLTIALALLALGAFAIGPMRVVEGLNVLVAREGRAPLPMAWLDGMRVTAQPPAYLRDADRRILLGVPARLPEGTLVTVRGIPVRDRKLVLTDGSSEVGFVSDGQGGVIARWTVGASGELTVGARFGNVLIEDPETLEIEAMPDEPPEVEVEGAPKTVELAKLNRLEIRYQASDDHGLRQIDLVLRAGNREDRRVLSRLDGESKYEQGGHALTARDPFLRRMFLPVVITVEARDADPLRGPKWGKSAAITLLPPAVGEPEAERFAALTSAHRAIVDHLAWQLGAEQSKDPAKRRREELDRAARASRVMKDVIDDAYGGLVVGGGLRAFLLGQLRVLERPARPAESNVRKTEEVVLAIDVALRRLSTVDAQSVSKRLADVADEVADGAKQARESEDQSAGLRRVDTALGVLELGAKQLIVLGTLGRDLGSVAQGEILRIKRARGADDLSHTELAARHLAARLRRPNASFAGAGRGGVESGGTGSNAMSGEPSQADDRFDQLASELEQLVQEHSDEIDKVDGALSEAEQAVQLDALADEAKRRAEAVRRALSELPQTGAAPGSARAAAALGKEHGSAMAQSLERLSLEEAVQSGRDAMSALSDAEKKAKDPKSPSDWLDQQALGAAKRGLAEQLAWAQDQLDKLERAAEARAKSALGSSGEREQQYADRAGNLAGRGKSGEAALPGDAVESLERAESLMREAARGLAGGRGDKSLELMREAQRLLERASAGKTTDTQDSASDSEEQGQRSNQETGGKSVRTGGEVPGSDQGKNAEEFRKRVLEGLGKGSGGRLAPAVKRYADGLLR